MDVDSKVLGRIHDFKGMPMDVVWVMNYVPLGHDIQHLAFLGVEFRHPFSFLALYSPQITLELGGIFCTYYTPV
jgi:hypothetical protein